MKFAWLLLCLCLAAQDKSDKLVVLISVDGLASYYFDDPKAHMPTLRKLAAEGAVARIFAIEAPPVVNEPRTRPIISSTIPADLGLPLSGIDNHEAGG